MAENAQDYIESEVENEDLMDFTDFEEEEWPEEVIMFYFVMKNEDNILFPLVKFVCLLFTCNKIGLVVFFTSKIVFVRFVCYSIYIMTKNTFFLLSGNPGYCIILFYLFICKLVCQK